jgi:hypothetical protein
MKKLLITASLLLSLTTLNYAQELKSVQIDQVKLADTSFSLSDNWVTHIENNSVLIYNGRIDNKSADDAKNLNLSLYLLDEEAKPESGNFNGYLVSSVPLKKINKNSNLVGVNIRKEISTVPPIGKYRSMLVLSDKKDNVLAYKITNSLVESNNEKLSIYKEQIQTATVKAPNLYPKVMIDLKEDNAIALEKEWKVDIDFKNFMVNITGGDISNNTGSAFDEVILDVYLTKEDQTKITKTFDGVHIASANINAIEANKKFVDTAVKTNMFTIPAPGTYHILLTVSSSDKTGKAVRNKRAFLSTITF